MWLWEARLDISPTGPKELGNKILQQHIGGGLALSGIVHNLKKLRVVLYKGWELKFERLHIHLHAHVFGSPILG